MPLSSSDQEQAEQAEATCPPTFFTTEEIMAFQVVAQRLKINLSDMIRLAEIRQQNPNAPFLFLNDHVAKSASLIWSPHPTTELTTESASYDTANVSTRHTTEEQGDEGYEAIQPDILNSAAAGFAGEPHQANVLEGEHGLAVTDTLLTDSGGNSSSQIFTADTVDISFLQNLDSLDPILSTTWDESIDPQSLSAIGKAPVGNPAPIQQTSPPIHDSGRLNQNPNAAPQPFPLTVSSAQLASSVLSPGVAPTINAQFPNNVGNTIPEEFKDFISVISAETHLAGDFDFIDFIDLENWRLDPEASDHSL